MKFGKDSAVIEAMSKNKIKMPAGITLRSVMGHEAPTASSIREMAFEAALDEDFCKDALRHLVAAYTAKVIEEAEAEDEEVGFELVTDSDDWEAEKVWKKWAIIGVHNAIPATRDWDEDRIMENFLWYDLPKMLWPDQLLAEVAFVYGYTEARKAKAMSDYVASMDAKHGPEWWKDPEKLEEF